MKMITAIVNKDDAGTVSHLLTKGGFSVTRMATSGGFLMAGNTTLLTVTEDDKVDKAIEIISGCAKQHTEVVPSGASYGPGVAAAYPLEVMVGGATIFVTNVEKFIKI